MWLDTHYKDQAQTYIEGGYVRQSLRVQDVLANTRSILTLTPAP